MPNGRQLSPQELCQLAAAACPTLGAALALAERVSRLNPDAPGPERIGAGMLAQLVFEARQVVEGHGARDPLRVNHAELQEALRFMVIEYGADLAAKYPATHRITRATLDTAQHLNPAREPERPE